MRRVADERGERDADHPEPRRCGASAVGRPPMNTASPLPMNTASPRPINLAQDLFRTGEGPLDAIFTPKNVAVIGATEKPNSVGRTILGNLVGNPFGGAVFPVNPKRPSVLGIKAYPSITAVPDRVDLAVIV